jgi:hypothetical protein
MYNVLWLMSMLMDCSFGHGEFAVDVSQALKQFQFSNRKKPYFRRTTVITCQNKPTDPQQNTRTKMFQQVPKELNIDIIRRVWKQELTCGSDTFSTLLPLSQVSRSY